jgi:hypothetical protein
MGRVFFGEHQLGEHKQQHVARGAVLVVALHQVTLDLGSF